MTGEQYKKAQRLARLISELSQKIKNFKFEQRTKEDNSTITVNDVRKIRFETARDNIGFDIMDPLNLGTEDKRDPVLVELNEKLRQKMENHIEIFYNEIDIIMKELEVIFQKI